MVFSPPCPCAGADAAGGRPWERRAGAGAGGEGGEGGRGGRAAGAVAGAGAAPACAAAGYHAGAAAAAHVRGLWRRRAAAAAAGAHLPDRPADPTAGTAPVAQLAQVHQPHHVVRLPPPSRGGRVRRRLLRVQGCPEHHAAPAVQRRAAGAQPAAGLAAARGRRGGAEHHPGVRVAEGGARVAAGHGARHHLVQLRHHAGRGRAAHVLLHAGLRRPGRGDGGVLHRHGAVRVLGDAARGVHGAGVGARGAAGGQVPRAERPRVPDGGGRVRVGLRVVRGGDRRDALPVPGADDPGAGAEPCVDGGGDAERGEPDVEPGDRALLPARDAVERAVQLPSRADVQPRQRLPGVAVRAHHRGAAHPGARAQPPGGRGRVHVLLRALLPQRHERRLQLRQQLGLRPHRGVRAWVRAGVAEHVGPVRGAAGDGGAGGLRHHELGLLPDGRDQRRALRGAGRLLGVRHAPALHGHRVAAGLLRRVPHDPDRDGAAAGLRGVLLRLLRREPGLSGLRLHHPRAAAQDARGPRPARADASVPAPARRRLTPHVAALDYRARRLLLLSCGWTAPAGTRRRGLELMAASR